MEDFIPEKHFENSPCSVSKTNTKKILFQMENCICKLDDGCGSTGTGFFCKINYPQLKDPLPILVTNNHVLSSNKLKINDIICITINGKSQTIKIDNNRIIFTSKKLDVTFIQIKPNIDKIGNILDAKQEKENNKLFLEIDEDIFNEDYETIKIKYKKKSIYIIHHENGDEASVSYGLLNSINDNSIIYHSCNTGGGSSGSPILNLKNFKLIGIHCGVKNLKYNFGILIREAVNKFFERNIKKEFKIKFKDGGPIGTLFNPGFIRNNKDKCIVIYKGKEFGLEDLDNIEEDSSKNREIILKEKKKITNMSDMFNGYIGHFIDCPNWDTSNIIDMSNMFHYCHSLPDISKWDTSNVTNMSNMFNYCHLESFPDISGWDTSNVIDMSNMFHITELRYLPDISKWDTSNVTNMSYMFHCNDLISLPDISKWDTSNVQDMSYMFSNCPLESLPDISKWDTSNVQDMSYMFSNCLLESLPDISKWNTSNVTNMSNMFSDCSFISLPDISNWNISNVSSLSHLFYKCDGLKTLPDISKWNTSNVEDMSFMFCFCTNLSILPNISKWNISNVKNMNFMFHNCFKLTPPNISNWNIENIKDKEHMLNKLPHDINISGKNINVFVRVDSYFDLHLNCCQEMIVLDLFYEIEKLIRKKSKNKKFHINEHLLFYKSYVLNKEYYKGRKIIDFTRGRNMEIKLIIHNVILGG